MVSKSKAEYIHGVNRARDRHDLSEEDLAVMGESIRSGNSIYLGEGDTKTRSIHLVQRGARYYPVVYEKKRGTIVTVLPDGYRIR